MTQGTEQDFYRQLSSDQGDIYRREVIRFVPGYREMQRILDAVREYTAAHPQGAYAIADLGCGPGDTMKSIIMETQGRGNFYFVDKEEGMIASAKRTVAGIENVWSGSNKQFSTTDADKFAPPEKLDVVVSSLVLHNIIDPLKKEDVLQKIYLNLKDGGLFVWSDFALLDDPIEHEQAVAEWVKTAWDRGADAEFITTTFQKEGAMDNPQKISEMKMLLSDTGFSSIQEVWRGTTFVTLVARK